MPPRNYFDSMRYKPEDSCWTKYSHSFICQSPTVPLCQENSQSQEFEERILSIADSQCNTQKHFSFPDKKQFGFSENRYYSRQEKKTNLQAALKVKLQIYIALLKIASGKFLIY